MKEQFNNLSLITQHVLSMRHEGIKSISEINGIISSSLVAMRNNFKAAKVNLFAKTCNVDWWSDQGPLVV